jgi:nitrite reductase/ring-hydroxylating ferredoxin subunit
METSLASVQAVTPGKMIGVEINGKNILIVNLNGKYFAIGNSCTHEGCLLSDGTLNGEKIYCACHGSTFDLRTGAVVKGPAKDPEPSYELKIEKDQIWANL